MIIFRFVFLLFIMIENILFKKATGSFRSSKRLLDLSFTSEQSDKQEQQNMTGCLLRFIYTNKGFFNKLGNRTFWPKHYPCVSK